MAMSKSPMPADDEHEKPDSEVMGTCESYTPEEEKAVLRKIDMVVLPFVCSSYPPVALTNHSRGRI